MAMKTAANVAEKWVRNTSSATESVRQGVQAVTESPADAAIRNKANYLAGVQRAFNDGSYEAGLRRVTLQDWQAAMLNKGLSRISAGVQASKGKMQAFMERWLPYEEELSRRIAAMPKGTLADSKARADFAIEYNAAFKARVM